MAEDDQSQPTLLESEPTVASSPWWVRPYPAHGWANRTQAERWQHVIERAKERGGCEVTPEIISSLETEIAHVRALTHASKKVPPYMAQRVKRFPYPFRQDYYQVNINGTQHVVVWSRRCNGLISYAYAGTWRGDFYR